jgi:hypothetical protein
MWAEHLVSKGHEVVFSEPKMVYWDIKDSLGNYYEVKLDEKALYYARKQNRPPNMFMEYWSTKRNEACGVMVLEVNYFVYIVKQLEKCFMAYVFDYEPMKEHLIKTEYKSRDNSATGDNNALGWLVPIHEITNSSDSGFIKSVIL